MHLIRSRHCTSEMLSEQGKFHRENYIKLWYNKSAPAHFLSLLPVKVHYLHSGLFLTHRMFARLQAQPHLFCLLLSVVLRYPHKMQTNTFSPHFVHRVPTEFGVCIVAGLSYKRVLFVKTNLKAAIVVVVSCSDKSVYICFVMLMFA